MGCVGIGHLWFGRDDFLVRTDEHSDEYFTNDLQPHFQHHQSREAESSFGTLNRFLDPSCLDITVMWGH
jgi:hypothetical protein